LGWVGRVKLALSEVEGCVPLRHRPRDPRSNHLGFFASIRVIHEPSVCTPARNLSELALDVSEKEGEFRLFSSSLFQVSSNRFLKLK
jgi:hypothetical protein